MLARLSDSQDNDIDDEVHTIKSVANHSDISLLSVADCVEFSHTKQCLGECKPPRSCSRFYLFIYLGLYVAFNTVQVISRWVVGRAEETST